MQNRFLLLTFLILTISISGISRVRAEDTAPAGTKVSLIPLPVYATVPNEGSTWGFMPVFLYVDPKTGTTKDILAPNITWNQVIGTTGTFRWFSYPSDTKGWTVILSASTHINWGGRLEYTSEPPETGAWADHAQLRFGRSLFYRFYGIGPDTPEDAQTSHTRLIADFSYRRGINIAPGLNVGVRVRGARTLIEGIGVSGYPLSTDVFPNAPGMSGPTAIAEEQLDIFYDTRKSKDYSIEGFYAGLRTGPAQLLQGNGDAYVDTTLEAKELFTESSRFQAGARLYARYVTSPTVPFYDQGSLGGSFLMRGLIEDRYIDQGAWTAEFEQRIQLFQTHIYGVTADWRVDPFVAVGQVFGQDASMFSNVKVAEGLGFRAWVRPNVLGRVDVAYAGEGVNTYVELGYPF